MVEIKLPKETYILRWNGKAWIDRAGHVWELRGDSFYSKQHGKATLEQWRIPL